MCLLTTVGSGFVVTPEAQSRGAIGLLGVVGEASCIMINDESIHVFLRDFRFCSLNNSIVCFMKIIKEEVSVNCLILLRFLANIYWLLRIAAGREGQKNEKKNENIPVILSYEAP